MYNLFYFTEYFVNERHNFLIRSIGAMPEEHNALFQIKLMVIFSHATLLTFFAGQVLFYWLFNQKCHPLAEIIIEGKYY